MATILIADDDPEYLQAFEAGMTVMGHDVITVSGSKSVTQRVLSEDPRIDIVFLDFIMPDSGGVSTLHAVKTVRPDVPVVIISGHASALDSPVFVNGMSLAEGKLAKTTPLAELHDMVLSLTTQSDESA